MRTREKFLIIAAAIAGMVIQQRRSSAQLIVSPWEVDCLADSSSNNHTSVTFIENDNPWQASHAARLSDFFYARASYDFGWVGDSAHFDIASSQHLAQLSGITLCEGRIPVKPMVDSFVSFWGTWDYTWPGSVIGTTDLQLAALDNVSGDIIVDAAAGGGNAGLGPPFGHLSAANSGLLLAGNEYLLTYSARIHHLDPTPPGTYGEGSGEAHFNITPVPEPATLALLPMALLFRRRSPSN